MIYDTDVADKASKSAKVVSAGLADRILLELTEVELTDSLGLKTSTPVVEGESSGTNSAKIKVIWRKHVSWLEQQRSTMAATPASRRPVRFQRL
eukprot:SAG11_NODE_206_length_12389_cov_11.831192_9_plen_94_part_00